MKTPFTRDSFNQGELTRIVANLSSSPSYTATVGLAVARKLMEMEFVFCQGDLRDIKVKHLGVGVYKVFTEPRK